MLDIQPSELEVDPNTITYDNDFVGDVEGVIYDEDKQFIPKGVYELEGQYPPEQGGVLVDTDMTTFGDYVIVYPDIEIWANQECTERPQVGERYDNLYAKLNYDFYGEIKQSWPKLRNWDNGNEVDEVFYKFYNNAFIFDYYVLSISFPYIALGNNRAYVKRGVIPITEVVGGLEITNDTVFNFGNGSSKK